MEDALVLKADPSFVERDVIVQIVAGDAQMYRQLVDRYHRGLVNYLVNVLGDADQAEGYCAGGVRAGLSQASSI